MKNLHTILLGISLVIANTAEAVPITSPLDPALSGANVVTFESQALGSYPSLTIGGVTITGAGDLTISNDGNAQYVPPQDQFLDNRLYSGSFTFSFSNLVTAFGLQIGATNAPWQMTAYDSSNNVIDTLGIPDQVSSLAYPYTGFYGLGEGSPTIKSFTLSSSSSDWIVLDDLYYTDQRTNNVPEPASITLLAAGLLGFGALRRKKNQA